MDKLPNVDRQTIIAVAIEMFLKVNPTHAFWLIKRTPAVQYINLALVVINKEFFEILENLVYLLWIKASRHDHMTSNQENCIGLPVHIAACREDEFVVCVSPCNQISCLIKLVDINQRVRHEILSLNSNTMVVSQWWDHGNDDVLVLQRMLCHPSSLHLFVQCDVKSWNCTKKWAFPRTETARARVWSWWSTHSSLAYYNISTHFNQRQKEMRPKRHSPNQPRTQGV